jgi:hypothetical protein
MARYEPLVKLGQAPWQFIMSKLTAFATLWLTPFRQCDHWVTVEDAKSFEREGRQV